MLRTKPTASRLTGGLMICCLMLSAAFPLRTARSAEIRVANQGKTWLIDSQDPNVQIRITDSGKTVTILDVSGKRQIEFNTHSRQIRIKQGEDVIEVPFDGQRPFQLRRGNQVIATLRQVPNADEATRRKTPPSTGRRPTPKAGVHTPTSPKPIVQKLFTVSRDGRLIRLDVQSRGIGVRTIRELGDPFRAEHGLTEGLAMDEDGQLYAAVNLAVNFTRPANATGQENQAGESLLYRIDSQTGGVQRIGPIGHRQVDGLSFAPDGNLYGVTSILGGGGRAQLLRIDKTTGRAQVVRSNLPQEDLDCIEVVSANRALIIDGMGLRDAFYELSLDGRNEPRRLAPTPNIIHNSRDLEALTFGKEDGFLYAFTSPDASPDARVRLVRIDPKSFKQTAVFGQQFGAYCLAADRSSRRTISPATDKTQKLPSGQPNEIEDVHRHVAQLAIRSGGSVNLQVEGNRFRKWIQNARQIPEERFEVYSLRFGSGITLGPKDLKAIGKLGTLLAMDAPACGITDEGLGHIVQNSKLMELRINGNPVTDAGLKHLAPLRSLQMLWLEDCKITDAGLTYLTGRASLNGLNLENTRVTDNAADFLARMPGLRILDLENTGVTDAAVKRLSALPNLEVLYLNATRITDESLAILAGHRTLKVLQVDDTRVSDRGLLNLPQIPRLESLSLNGTDVTDAGIIATVTRLLELKGLRLENTKLTNRGLIALEDLPNLRNLRIDETQVTTAGIAKFRAVRPKTYFDGEPRSAETSPNPQTGTNHRERFVNQGPFVRDVQTGLLWQKDGDISGKLNFSQAKEYAENLNPGGLTGWRLPTAKELETIFPATAFPFRDSKYTPVACCQGPFEWNSYWTSQIRGKSADVYHWYEEGGVNGALAQRNFIYVRCVHDPIETPVATTNMDADATTNTNTDIEAEAEEKPERRFTKWFVKSKERGSIGARLEHGNRTFSIRKAEDIPKEEFAITSINVYPEAHIPAAWLEQVVEFPSLLSFSARTDRFDDESLRILSEHDSLRSLSLESSGVTDAGLRHVAKLTSLISLELKKARISSLGIASLVGLSNLMHLRIVETRLTDESAAAISQMRTLTSLGLEKSLVTEQGLAMIAKLPKLRSLQLSESNVGDDALGALSKSRSIESLGLDNTKVTDDGLKFLKKLRDLSHLSLHGCQITDDGIKKHVARLSKLEFLRLEHGDD